MCIDTVLVSSCILREVAPRLSPIWLIPIAMSVALNLRMALSMKNKDRHDVLFAGLIVPAEVYMWIRISHFLRSWSRFLSRKKVDNWAMQAKAERGAGIGHWTPLIVAVAIVVAVTASWHLIPIELQSGILAVGWPVLGVITVIQTLSMFMRLLRRQHGFKV